MNTAAKLSHSRRAEVIALGVVVVLTAAAVLAVAFSSVGETTPTPEGRLDRPVSTSTP